jgi:23S rRNA (uridine2552-2'-O)-methyltransferase
MSKLTGSSARWLARQQRDAYVKRAKQDGFASRAAFKLSEIEAKFRFVRPSRGARLLDVGAAPGGFTQTAMREFAPSLLVSVDLLPLSFAPMADTHHLLLGDAGNPAIQAKIEQLLLSSASPTVPKPLFDVVFSDMAPTTSGIVFADAARAVECVQVASSLCVRWLRDDGALLAKFRMAGDARKEIEALLKRDGFGRLRFAKPPSSRAESQEMFVIGDQFRRSRDRISIASRLADKS